MAKTPEGQVKNELKSMLIAYAPRAWYTMPIGGPYASKGVPDFIICVCEEGSVGRFIAVETKALGKKPTRLQEFCHSQIRMAGGQVWVIDSTEGILRLEAEIRGLLGVDNGVC